MAIPADKTDLSTQSIQNYGFDKTYKIPIRLLYGFNSDTKAAEALTKNANGLKVDDAVANSLVPSSYDYIALSYTDGNLTEAVFKAGGADGDVVSTLTLAYTGGNLTSVVKT